MAGMKAHVSVLGAGSWGTALGLVLARSGRTVRLYTKDAAQAERIRMTRENGRYLPGITLPPRLEPTDDLAFALDGAEAVVVAVPSDAAPQLLERVAPMVQGYVIAAFKGIQVDTLERSDELMLRIVGPERMAILSGPSFAVEVAQGLPTATTMAAPDLQQAGEAATFFEGTNIRIYTSDDPCGVAIGGALKNVIAIAAGAAEGLGLGHNSIAAAVTRGLAEMARMSAACGGRSETLMGLSGLGDLVLTCTGNLSRNRRLGMAIAKGKTVQQAQRELGQVVEGVNTAKAAVRLAEKYGVEIPLMDMVYRVLQGEVPLPEAVRKLLSRPEKAEFA